MARGKLLALRLYPRYPTDKTGETGIIFEPWHYRYVGKEAAREIMEQGICLEEYLGEK